MCNNKSKERRQYLLRTANNHILGIYPQINKNVNHLKWISFHNTLYTVTHKAESLTLKAATVPFLGVCSYNCSFLFVSTFFYRTMRKFNLLYRGTSVCTVKQDWLLNQMQQICSDIFSLWQHWSFTPWVKYFLKKSRVPILTLKLMFSLRSAMIYSELCEIEEKTKNNWNGEQWKQVWMSLDLTPA